MAQILLSLLLQVFTLISVPQLLSLSFLLEELPSREGISRSPGASSPTWDLGSAAPLGATQSVPSHFCSSVFSSGTWGWSYLPSSPQMQPCA